MKVVINTCYGGFSLSRLAEKEYWKRKGQDVFFYHAKTGDWKTFYRLEDSISHNRLWHAVSKDLGPGPIDYKEINNHYLYSRDMCRDDPDLVAVIEDLGKDANGTYAQLKVVEIPDGIEYEIEEHDGREWVAEKHRTWN